MKKNRFPLLFTIFLLMVLHTLTSKADQSISSAIELFEQKICVENEEAKTLYNAILQKLKVNPDPDIISQFYATAARWKYCQGLPDSSVYFFKRSAGTAFENNDLEQTGRMFNNVGALFQIRGKLDSSLIYYDSALHYANQVSDMSVVGSVMIGKGIVYEMQGMLQQALLNYLEAERLFGGLNVEVLLTSRINRYAILTEHFPDQMNYNEVLVSYEMAKIDTLEEHQASIIQFIGNHARINKDFEQALKFYDEGIFLSKKTGRPDLQVFLLEGKGHTYLDMEKYNEAMDALSRARELAENNDLQNALIQTYVTLSEVCLKTNENQKAIYYADLAIKRR